MKTKLTFLLVASLVTSAASVSAAEPTALELIREGNRYVGEQFKDKIGLIRSEKSVATLTPQSWLLNYRSEFTSLKGVEVKFVGGKMADVDTSMKGGRPFELSRIKVDSDKALSVVTNEPILKNLTLRASKMSLERIGDANMPAWRVQLCGQTQEPHRLRRHRRDPDLNRGRYRAEERPEDLQGRLTQSHQG